VRDFRTLRSLGIALAIAGAASGVAGCGGSSGFTIDHTVVQNAVAAGIAQQQHILTIVSCPPGVKAHKGGHFVCTVTFANGSQTAITVTELDARGNVHYAGLRGYVNGRPPAG
jgi:Domain of unknown function (DUF4333)